RVFRDGNSNRRSGGSTRPWIRANRPSGDGRGAWLFTFGGLAIQMSVGTQHKTRTLWLTGVLHAFTHLYQVALLPLYLRIQQDLRLGSVDQATLLVTVMGLAYFIPSYPLGALADRLSRK